MMLTKKFATMVRSAALGAVLLAGTLVATPPSQVFAQSSAASAGRVFFLNQSASPLTIRCNSFVDSDGDTRKVNGSWLVEAEKGIFLNVKSGGVDVPLRASKFNYRVTTPAGSSDWTSTGLDGDGDLSTVFSKDDFATHRRIAAQGAAPKGLVETKAVRTVARSADVCVKNPSPYPASITGLSYVDSSGVKRSIEKELWKFDAGEAAYLVVGGGRINASRIDLAITINGKTSTWYVNTAENLEDGRLTFTVDSQVLAKHVTGYVPASGGPSEEQVKRAIAKLIGAMVAQGVATSGNSDEDGLGELLARGFAVVGREALIESAVDDLFGSRPANERAAVRRVIGLILEGRLTAGDFGKATIKDAIKDALKEEAPGMAGAVDVVDFLGKLQDAREKAR